MSEPTPTPWREVSFADGIRVVELPNIEAFFCFVSTICNDSIDPLLWRGQRRSEWEIKSTLAREGKSGDFLLQNYRDAVARCTNREFDLNGEAEKLKLWSIGQHNGLRTPLIDWTTYPFTALFFAFAEQDEEGGASGLRARCSHSLVMKWPT
jgi:hypothetical protein